MRFAVFALVVLLGGCAAYAGQAQFVSFSPRGVEIAAWCGAGGWNCRQAASDLASAYCHGRFEDNPRRAIYVESGPVERSFFQGERVVFVYRCDRRPIVN